MLGKKSFISCGWWPTPGLVHQGGKDSAHHDTVLNTEKYC